MVNNSVPAKNLRELIAYSKAFSLSDDTNTREIGTRVTVSLELAEKLGDPAILEPAFAKNVGLAQTEDQRGQLAYLAAREASREENYGTALGILKMVAQGKRKTTSTSKMIKIRATT